MAARNIRDTIERAFQSRTHSYGGYNSNVQINNATKYMTIPITGETFEIPLFAFKSFTGAMFKEGQNPHSAQCIVATLEESGHKGWYKTLDANMKECLLTDFSNKLLYVEVENGVYYFVTHGAVFDKDLKPMMMMSWIIEKVHHINVDESDGFTYNFIKPVIRLSPECFSKADAMQRYLTGKFLTTSISMKFHLYWWGRDMARFFPQTNNYYESNFNIKVEIDECSFLLRGVDTPSISTTNESLVQLALRHIDEIAA